MVDERKETENGTGRWMDGQERCIITVIILMAREKRDIKEQKRENRIFRRHRMIKNVSHDGKEQHHLVSCWMMMVR